MAERRLTAVVVCAVAGVVLAAVGAAGCAGSGGGGGSAAAKGGSGGAQAPTDALIKQSAAGLERALREWRRAEVAPDREVVVESAATPAAVRPMDARGEEHRGERAVAGTADPVGAPVAPGPIAPVAAGGSAAREGLSGWWGPEGTEQGGAQAAGAPASGGAAVGAAPGGSPAAKFWAAEAGEGATMKISELALCWRIDGFGKVVRVESLRAGRPATVLIYTQVDGFSAQEEKRAGGESRWVIELGQSVVVYRLSEDGKGDVQVKVEPEQTARDVAGMRRRDHYLVQRIELPTRVAGKYAVKVTVRDKKTGMVDERVAEVVVR